MASISGKTQQNLLAAFLGESADQNRYFFYAKVAKKEGYIALSTAFEEIAMQERSHAKNFLRHLEPGELTVTSTFFTSGIGTNMENLVNSVTAETRQHEILYPAFADSAREEGFTQIATLFSSIAMAEKHHARRLQSFIDDINGGNLFTDEREVAWVCAKCGYVHVGKRALEVCPACGHGKEYFERSSLY